MKRKQVADGLCLPAARGSYQLVLHLKKARTIWVGEKLGPRFFLPGYYIYTGSAMGSGGIEARVRRHLDKNKITRHWHIDYLTTHPEVEVVEVIRRPSMKREECKINQATERLLGAAVPVPGFGKSDSNKNPECTCTAHLVQFGGPFALRPWPAPTGDLDQGPVFSRRGPRVAASPKDHDDDQDDFFYPGWSPPSESRH